MSTKTVEGQLQAQGLKFAVITARFNDLVTSKLHAGAIDCLKRHGVNESDIIESWVPGAFELPLAAQTFAKSQKLDGIICLGAVIRGATPHFDYVCNETAKGVAKVSLDYNIPVSFGVITTENLEQALERSGSKAGNKGWEAAMANIEMASLIGRINAFNAE